MMDAVRVGEIYCVAAHPYMRWTVAAVTAGPGSVPNILLRSTADPSVERTVALPVLQNPSRFTRVSTSN